MQTLVIATTLPQQMNDNINRMKQQFSEHILQAESVQCNYILMHYIGQVADADVVYFAQALESVSQCKAPLISIASVASVRKNNQIVARLKSHELNELHDKLSVKLDELGITIERAYRPYLPMFKDVKLDMPYREVNKKITIYNKPIVSDKLMLISLNDGAVLNEITLPIE